jgi:hypothetical protein
MTRYISKLQAVNWNRGLHRVFALLCLFWLGFWCVYIPMDEMKKATTYAAQTDIREYEFERAFPAKSPEEKATLRKENWERATWSYQYKKIFVEQAGALWIIVLIPAVGYLLIRLFLMLSLWLYRGFNTPKEGA